MGKAAAGAYLWELRKSTGLSRDDVAKKFATSRTIIEGIETGERETRSSLLLAFTRLVNGSAEQITDLLLDEKTTAEDGREAARNLLKQLSDAELANVIRIFQHVKQNPSSFDRLIGYADRLLEEEDAAPPQHAPFPDND